VVKLEGQSLTVSEAVGGDARRFTNREISRAEGAKTRERIAAEKRV